MKLRDSCLARFSGVWEDPERDEEPLVFSNRADCPTFAKDVDCFRSNEFKGLSPDAKADFRARAAKVSVPVAELLHAECDGH